MANLQGGDLVQLGYAGCTPVSGNSTCQAGFPAHVSSFWYTQNANGYIYPASWYDINQDGTMDRPISAHQYKLWFDATTNSSTGAKYWRYYIQDLTAGTPYVGSSHVRHDSSEPEAWWGYEVWNDASAIGDLLTDPYFDLHAMKTRTSGTWSSTYVQGDSACYSAGPPMPSWATCTFTHNTSTETYFDVYTRSHQ